MVLFRARFYWRSHRDEYFALVLENVSEELRNSEVIPMVYFNRGNMKAELGDMEGAVSDYTVPIENNNVPSSELFFNRGNALASLNRFDEAIGDYDQVIHLGHRNALFNKGNTLVRLGKFDDALQCYNELLAGETFPEGTIQNRDAAQEILAQIDGKAYVFGRQHEITEPKRIEVVFLILEGTRDNVQVEDLVFCGNVGNTGNFGFNMHFGFNAPSGKGFGGKDGFIVRLLWTESVSTDANH